MNLIFRYKKILSYLLIIPIIISLSFSSLAVSSIYAQSIEPVIPVPVNDINRNAKATGFTIMGHSIPGFDWNSIYKLVMNTLLAQITDSIINWINSGFEGAPSFVTDPQKFLVGVADEIAGEFINGTKWGWVCDPFKLNIRIALTLGLRRFERQRKCTLTGILKNFDNFFTGTFKEGGWQSWFEITTNPSANGFTSFLTVEAEMIKRMNQNKDMEIKKLDWGRSFMSWRSCEKYREEPNPFSEVKTKLKECEKWSDIKTPGSVIAGQIDHTLGTNFRQLELADDIDKIVGALVAQLVRTVLQKGLSSMSYSNGWSGTASDFEGSGTKIMATCSATAMSAGTGDTVEWTSYVAGGTFGTSPSYKWTGDGITDGMLNNNTTNGKNLRVRYHSVGVKTATLTATKDGSSVTVQCPGITITAKNNTAGSCSANEPEIKKGGVAVWTWAPYVWSNELYSTATYQWNGDDIGVDQKTNPITIPYSTAGVKSTGVVVTTEKKETICATLDSCEEKISYERNLYNCGAINVFE